MGRHHAINLLVRVSAVLLLFAVIFLLRLELDADDDRLGQFYVLPVVLVASWFGRWYGVFAAATALGLYVLQREAAGLELTPLAVASRAIIWTLLALMLGTYVERLRRTKLSLAREQEFLRAVLESIRDGVVACNAEGTLTYFNAATRELHGLDAKPLPSSEWAEHYDLYHADGRTPLKEEEIPLFRALSGELVRDDEIVIEPRAGESRRVLANGEPLVDGRGEKLGAVVAMHDITKQRQVEDELAYHALHDPLTGLANRTLLSDRLGHALELANRGAAKVAALFVDIDHFNVINDGYGQAAGDRLIVDFAERLSGVVRAADTLGRASTGSVARIGGDEFAVLCEQINDERDAVVIAERVHAALHEPFEVAGEAVRISASIGIALSSASAEVGESLVRDAGTATHRAKERGGGRYEVCDQAMRGRVDARIREEGELSRAIELDELTLYYQPIVSLTTGRMVAFEALVRWQHPDRGLIPPGDFIPLAEKSGLIGPLGDWVLERACSEASGWSAPSSGAPAPRIAVNLSARQLEHSSLLEKVTGILDRTGLDPGRLELEITETVLVGGETVPLELLASLQAAGVRLVLDDFGTGYSSLSYLGRLPLDVLKIDRSFISAMEASAHGIRIVTAVIELGRSLGMAVVAEGVETQSQLDCLKELDCPLAQGFHFSRPLPAEQIGALQPVVA